jgi:restriction system protein
MASRTRGPEFVRWFAPLLDTLRDLGNSGRPKEVSAKIAERLSVPDADLDRTNKNGLSRFDNQVAWARFYLAKAGLIDTSRRGVWTLTERGRQTKLDQDSALQIFQDIAKTFKGEQEAGSVDETRTPEEKPEEQNFREEMVHTLHALSPGGFEHLCKLILREVGFEEVTVTGQSNDGGIDGFGVLRTNRLITDRVLFQCKRHTKQVSPAYIREFRGAMANRANRGIFLATSTFSVEAKREASREGTTPIELVDLDGLISLLTELGLGVTTRTTFVIDQAFFRDYMPPSSLGEVENKARTPISAGQKKPRHG